MISAISINYWTNRWYKSCDRLKEFNEVADINIEPFIKIEQKLSKYYESKLMIAYELKKIFNVEIGSIFHN